MPDHVLGATPLDSPGFTGPQEAHRRVAGPLAPILYIYTTCPPSRRLSSSLFSLIS
jgi:hypothetical protein